MARDRHRFLEVLVVRMATMEGHPGSRMATVADQEGRELGIPMVEGMEQVDSLGLGSRR